MTAILILALSFWLLFCLFLYRHLGPERSIELWNAAVDRLDHALHP